MYIIENYLYLISIFQELFASLDKIFIWDEDWALSFNSEKFWDLLGIS